jgi:DNA-binding CsgD family transcriptional regulator
MDNSADPDDISLDSSGAIVSSADEANSPGPVVGEGELVEVVEEEGSAEYRTIAHGYLSPRHRKFALMAAEGKSNKEIGEALGYKPCRVSNLRHNTYMVDEIERLRERIFEETIGSRLKSFAEPALNNIHMILTDRTNKVKVSEKAEMSKWVVEMNNGKASQKIEAGENLLSSLMDRLDAGRTSRPSVVNIGSVVMNGSSSLADVTHSVSERPALSAPQEPKSEEDLLTDWVVDYTR